MLKYHIQTIEVNNTVTNLVTNPSFETNTTGWVASGGTITRITTDSVFGSASGNYSATALDHLVYIDSAVTPNTTYNFSGYVKGEVGKTYVLNIEERTASAAVGGTGSVTVTANGQWQRVGVTRTFGATGVVARVWVQNKTSGAHTMQIDGFMLTTGSTTEPYFDGNTTGVKNTTFGWTGTVNNSTSTRTSTSVTPNRTNLMTNPSFEVGSTQWVAARMTLSLDDTTFLYGSRALRGTVNSTTAQQYFDHGTRVTITANKTYTGSVWVYLPIGNTGATNVRAEFHPHTGSAFLGGIFGTTVTATKGQWTRLSVTGTMPATATSVMLRIYSTSILPLDDVMIIDGAMIEEGSLLGEYFDGNFETSTDYQYDWTGGVGVSASRQEVIGPVGTSNASSLVFNNIPQIYDDLELVVSPRFAGTRSSYGYRFNGDSSSSYPWRRLYGNGSSSVSSSGTGTTGLIGECPGTAETINTFASGKLYIPNYTSNTTKSALADDVSENNGTEAYQHIVANLWNGTSPISSISISAYGGPGTNFAQFSSASLYGIKRGADGITQGPPAFGGTITTSGGYTYHTFTTSGTFTANRSLNAEALIIAGGGGAERGGGGAGGVTFASTTLSPASYPVLVGAGGAAGNNTNGGNGGNSTFNGISAIGGGGGGTSRAAGNSGGSGGGGGHENGNTSFVAAGGAATSGQGFAGGSGVYQGSGGGGGAGGVGQNGTGNPSDISGGRGGDAGLGTNAYSVWATATGTGESGRYASGGGGNGYDDYHGKFALGGGGGSTDGNYATRRFALANMGGGASDYSAGGSGIVIIRYPTPA